MNVLLTNDDNINSPGLRALYHELVKRGHDVTAVAPMLQQSGVGCALTVFEPLRIREIREGDFAGIGVYGTPADCVKLALGNLASRTPDLVMAGINMGQNVGPDIFYSGTIGAASEGAHAGLPGMAISHASHAGCDNWAPIAAMAVDLAETIDWSAVPGGQVLNINFPDLPTEKMGGIRVCPQSPAVWRNSYVQRKDPRGENYWWLNGSMDESTSGKETDRGLLREGYITVTPLKFDYTARETLASLAYLQNRP